MPSYTDFDPEPDLNVAAPPVGAPEGGYLGKHVNNTFRYVMAVVRLLGDSALHKADSMDAGVQAGTIATQNANAVALTGGVLGTGALLGGVGGAVPLKGIIPFAGTLVEAATLVPYWAICDGRTVNAIVTPDLRGRFIRSYAPGVDDPGALAGSLAAVATSNAGAHSHGGTTSGHVLTEAELPAHRHLVMRNTADNPDTPTVASNNSLAWENNAGANRAYVAAGVSGNANVGRSSETGSGQSHNHSITSQAGHTHEVTPNPPPYYAVIYLMRTA